MRIFQLGEKLARVLHLVDAEVEVVDCLVVDPQSRVVAGAVSAVSGQRKERLGWPDGLFGFFDESGSGSSGFAFARERKVAMVSAAGDGHADKSAKRLGRDRNESSFQTRLSLLGLVENVLIKNLQSIETEKIWIAFNRPPAFVWVLIQH